MLEVSHFNISQIQLIVDFGLVVLIWMVQLIVYPSFLFFDAKNLISWHQKYTKRITVIVAPLMVVQLAIALLDVYLGLSTATIITLCIVVLLWVFTFLSFAPVHFKISKGTHSQKLLKQLILRNWFRTLLWSILFLYHFLGNLIFLK
ncbi:hypothetical protein [Polaribacter sp.]|uniref:hypothetical protein n=1 Tax=Polaribacter sp. TaxID=1920175 RepID=UPI003F6B7845